MDNSLLMGANYGL